MFKKLKQKWKVTSIQMALILFTFAIGGSFTGFIAKKLMNLLPVQQDWLWATIYIILLTAIWPLVILIVSIPFGQFPFFIKYIRKIGNRLGLLKSDQ
jgi:hypothetical protein